jgi:Flp pilus assembly protein TadD
MGLRRYPEALKFLDRAIRLRPNNACVWHEKGRLLGKMGREEEARAAFAEGIRLEQAGDICCSFWPNDLAKSLE